MYFAERLPALIRRELQTTEQYLFFPVLRNVAGKDGKHHGHDTFSILLSPYSTKKFLAKIGYKILLSEVLFSSKRNLNVIDEPPGGAADGLGAAAGRFPSHLLEFIDGQAHDFHIPLPAPAAVDAAGEGIGGREPHLLGDDVGDGSHVHPVLRAQVENVHPFLPIVHGKQHGLDAVMDIQIGFLLGSISQNLQMVGVSPQFVHEIVGDSVSAPGADHVGKPVDDGGHIKSVAVGGNEGFGGQLGGSVQGNGHQGTVGFGSGYLLGFPVHRGGGGETDGGYVLAAHLFQQIVGGQDVLLQVHVGILGSPAHVGVGGQMVHHVDALDGLTDVVGIEQVSLHQFQTLLQAVSDEFSSARRKVVQADHVVSLLHEGVDEVTADETGAAGDQDVHACVWDRAIKT